MNVIATMKTGGLVRLHEKYGSTPGEVLAKLQEGALTGSAVQWLDTADGGVIRADQIERLHG